MTPQKKTFAQITAEMAAAARANSDLQNLAHALGVLAELRQEAAAPEDAIKSTEDRIENGELVPVDQVPSLYNRAMGR